MTAHSGLALVTVLVFSFGLWSVQAVVDDGPGQFMQYDIRPIRDNQLQARAGNAVLLPLVNQQIQYATDMSIGSPPQKTIIEIDTGSTYFWVNPNCDTVPAEFGQKALCKSVPVYDPAKSSTAKGTLGQRFISYGSNGEVPTSTNVTIVQDTIKIGDTELTDMLFGVATNSSGISTGIMGLGPDLTAGFDIPSNATHAVVLNQLVAQGKINSRAYSVHLGHASAATGSLIFGGIDTGKFIGTLEKMPIVPGPDGNISAVVQQVYEALGAKYNASQGFALVDCTLRNMTGGVTFGFGGTNITVSFADFILSDGDACLVGLTPLADGSQQVLGDSFMRSAYVVFDWDNKNVLLAQSADCAPDIVAIGKGPDAVPSVRGSCQNSSGTAPSAYPLPTKPVPTAAASRAHQLTASCVSLVLASCYFTFFFP